MNSNVTKRMCVAAMLAVVVALIWIPYGFDMTALIEEWGMLRVWLDGITYLALPGGPFETFRLRMFTFLPYAVAHAITPESFLGWHFMLALSLFLKAVGMASLMHYASRNALVSFVAGLVFLVYPADTMQVSMRGIHAGWASALLVLALASFMWSTEAKTLTGRIVAATLATVIYATALLVYEVGILFALSPLFFWWARYGWSGLRELRRHWPEATIWGVCCLVWLLYGISVVTGPLSHQAAMASGPNSVAGVIFGNLPMLFSVGMYRTFFHGWYDGWRMLAANIGVLWPFAVAFVALLTFAWWLLARDRPWGGAKGPALRWAVIGLICAMLGYLPFLGALTHILITQRTYVFASVGGAIAVASLLWLAFQRSKHVGAALTLALLLSGMGSQWEQLRHYTDLSLRQREIFANVVTAVPDLPAEQPLLIIDNGGVLNNDWMARGAITRDALSYLYGHAVDVQVCVNPGMLFSSFVRDVKGNPGYCVQNGSEWTFGKEGTPIVTRENADLWIVTLSETGEATVTQGDLPASSGQPERWGSILNCWPAVECTYEEPKGSRFEYDFGTYWSLERAPWGAGWSDAFWNPPRLQPQSAAWTLQNASQLWFKIAPVDGNYLVRIDLLLQAQDAIAGSYIEVNGQRADLNWDDLYSGVATVPSSWLVDGVNSLVLHTKVYEEWGVGVAVDAVSVAPVLQ